MPSPGAGQMVLAATLQENGASSPPVRAMGTCQVRARAPSPSSAQPGGVSKRGVGMPEGRVEDWLPPRGDVPKMPCLLSSQS